MNDAVKVFKSEQFGSVRTVVRDQEPWFVGRDVAQALGYKEVSKAIREHIDDDDKGVSILDTPGGKQNITIINESGVYSLVLSSKLPQAKQFRRWITHDVIPSIRKHGAYATSQTIDQIISDPEYGIRLLTALKDEREKSANLQMAVEKQAVELSAARPKAEYCDKVLDAASDSLPITQIAKGYGMTGQKLNRILHDKGIQYPLNGTWVLYDQYDDLGYTQPKTFFDTYGRLHTTSYWTQKGRKFIYEILKGDGIVPIP